MPTPKNGNNTRWMIGLLALICMAVLGWVMNHHESDMIEATTQRGQNAEHIRIVSERTAAIEAHMGNLKDAVRTIGEGVKEILDRMPG